jgi:phosphocarrier protein
MTTIEINVNDPTGLHARPAARFVQAAKAFASKITVSFNGRECDAKSIMGIMSLAIKSQSLITVAADGADETQAAEKLKQFVESNFKEA